MFSTSLLLNLSVLKQARLELVSNLVDESSDIFIDMFRFENDSNTLRLSIDKFTTIWLDTHWNILIKNYEDFQIPQPNRNELASSFAKVMISLLSQFEYIVQLDSHNEDLLYFLTGQKKEYIEKLINISINAERNLNSMIYKKEKSKSLFDREILKLRNN